ncbi:hypothetical protein L1049_012145 [Liquidambar formosana]|uniref:Uncharacterized protein n=1 Tax=Liquidambar formosana TaxID=63359 RepID=A0AAP0RSI9_LIQFO
MEQNLELLLVGKEILEKCWGNPLAITTVARLLSDRRIYREWLEVKNLLWELAEEDTDILPSLRVSYAHLSSDQQKCFAHCALFQKGYKIEKATLIQLWMAGDLIQSSKNRILEDIGEEYFKTLLNRNFFEDEEMDECGNITSCKMHDLMHDLAQTAAGMDNYSIIRNDVDGAKISENVIHASISKPLRQFPTSILNAKKLRTFISTVHSNEDFVKFALTFKSLRVLGLVGFHCVGNFRNSNVLDPIRKLKQLRFLNLSYSDISTLPNSVCELQNLQTLKLHYCDCLTELPRDIKELKSLRHLENHRCYQLKGIPCGIGQLTCIQTLSLFVLGEGAGLSELETLNNLRGDLEIQIRENAATSVESRKACLKEKQYLQTLKLNLQESNGDVVSLEALQPNPYLKVLWIYRYGGVRFPSWMLKMGNSLPCLVQIKLFDCPRCVRFPLFAGLPCLKELSLSNLQSLEYIDSYISDSSSSFSSSFKGWFPSLKKVYLNYLPKLKEWARVVNDGRSAKTEAVAEQPTQQLLSLNSLEILEIRGCPELTSMPLHPNVEELKLDDVSRVLIESMTMAAIVSPTAAATSFTFSKLKSLQIRHCKDLMSPGEGWLGNLTSLERQEILNCPELNISDEDNDMPGLISLHSVQLSDLPKLVALPKVLQHSTALETLEIRRCPSLMTLPDWFGKLTSLQRLQIFDCRKLKSPVEGWLENLTSLKRLNISNYPELNISDEDNDMPGLISLHSLQLSDLPKLVALPKVLQHSTALETLTIENCPGLMTLPDWFGKLTSLQRLQIFNCSELKSPVEGWLENLTSLKRLNISNYPELNISDEDNDMPGLISLHSMQLSDLPKLVALPKVLQHSTALETLEIRRCPGLMTLPDWFGKLTSLHQLSISNCSELKSLGEGWLENLTSLKGLAIIKCPELNFSDEDNDMLVLRSLYSLELRALPKLAALPKVLQHNTVLKTLCISYCPGLMTLPDWFGKLTSLQRLQIFDCSELKSPVEGWLENLTSLKRLNISNCPELNISDEDNDMPGLISLHLLQLSHLPKLVALPKVLQHSTALETLTIENCPGLMTLPDWFGKLTSLQGLHISSCSELKSPVEGWLENLTSLKYLDISNCSELNISDEDNDMPSLISLHSLQLSDLPKLAALPKVLQHNTVLGTLNIRHCPGLMTLPDWFGKLTSLQGLQISSCSELKSPVEGWLENLTSLKQLYISNCPELNISDEDNDMPGLISLHSLQLSDLPKLVALPKVLQHSTALKTLKIENCPGLMTLPDWFGKLTSLQRLQISSCSELKSPMEGWLENLTSLKWLNISNCPELNISDEDNDMPSLISLHLLQLSDLPKLVALPKVLQHSTALETLKIENCPGLMTLPDWFGKLTSLQRLQISGCSELKSPVEGWLQNLTSLKQLYISNCLELNISDEDNDMPGLISLHSLQLLDLPMLVALPKVLQHSTALKTLKIENCPV